MRYLRLFEDFNGDDIVEEIEDLFLELSSDYDFEIDINDDVFFFKKDGKWIEPDWTGNNHQRLTSGVEYHMGFSIFIEKIGKFNDDLTYEFQTIVSQLSGMGWELGGVTTLYKTFYGPKVDQIRLFNGGLYIYDRDLLNPITKPTFYFVGNEKRWKKIFC